MIERIQNGVTREKFYEYFKRCHNLQEKIKFLNVYDPKILKNYKSLRTLRSFKISIARVTNGNIFASQEKSVSQIVDASKDTNADQLTIEYKSVGKGNHLNLPKFRSLVDLFKRFNSDGMKQVGKMEVYGQDEDGNYFKPFDLVSEVMRRKIYVEYTRHINEIAIKARMFEIEKMFLFEREDLLATYDKRVNE